MVPYIPTRAKIPQNSLVRFSVYFVVAWYSLICIVKISDLRNKNNFYVISIIVTTNDISMVYPTSQSSKVSPLCSASDKLFSRCQAKALLARSNQHGNLTVLHRPDAGKKLGNRRRPRSDHGSDRTMTQNKNRKV